ncbi:MAG TPA: VOC family protein [Bryobacteraceae bacterium]|nr:VOC family protein [Bryobacteraceae bacterium]
MSEQRIIPYLAYDDAPAAITFLCEAFGFTERFRMPTKDGRIGHAEVAYRDNIVMLASTWRVAGAASPRDLAGVHTQLHCTVDDVDAHYERAREAGATIIGAPADQPHGTRMYRAVDPEGHRWIFGSPIAAKK